MAKNAIVTTAIKKATSEGRNLPSFLGASQPCIPPKVGRKDQAWPEYMARACYPLV